MPIVPAPMLCLWSPTAVDPACVATWRERIGDAVAAIELPLCIGDPLAALRAAATAHPDCDLLLADARALVSVDGVRTLLAAARANPQFDAISALGRAVAALDPLPADIDGEHAAALCAAWGEHGLFASTQWSPGLSVWRANALRRIDALTPAMLPEPLAGAVHGALYVDSPRMADFPAEAAPFLRVLRMRLATRRDAPGWMPAGRPVLLHILHGWGGGAERFVRDLMRADDTRAHLVLVARGSPDAREHGQRLALHHDLDAPPLREWPLTAPIADTALRSPEYAAVLSGLIDEWGIAAVLVSSLIGHSLDALRSGLPTAVCTHDYYPLWPALHADFGDVRAHWDDAAMTAAWQDAAALSPFAPHPVAHWIALRAAYLDALAAADTGMVAPTQGVRANQCRIAPVLAQRSWRVIAHGIDVWPPLSASPLQQHADAPRPLRVLVLGSIHGGKGEALLSEVLQRLDAEPEPLPIEFVLLGSGDAGMRFFGRGHVHMLRDYAYAELPRRIAELHPDLALLPVGVAETWSYTLSELWSLGVPVLATRRGSLAERIEHGVNGLLVDAEPAAIAAMLRQLAQDRSALQALHAPTLPDLRDMAAAWRDALPASSRAPAPALAAGPQRMQSLVAEVELTLAREREASLREQAGEQRAELDRRAAWAFELEGDLRASQQALAQRDVLDAERALLQGSRSWRYTAPLRRLHSAFAHATQRLRFSGLRTRALVARTLASLRRNGVAGTLKRARQEFRQVPVASRNPLPAPADDSTDIRMPAATAPHASIVVPVYNHLPHTLACLRSLANSGDATPFEVIVVDDASSDDTPQRLRAIAGLHYRRNPRNLGFISACNAGATTARGEYIVFLNNDTVVQPGWLDALLRTFAEHADAGLVGAKLVYPDGRLQEAGSIVFNDASGWNYGRFEQPDDPRYNHLRDVDYCSGAAIALPTELFRRLGGFDTRYAPAYYEDTDLAMQVRAAGLRVLYQPASVVVHFEGLSAGTDINAGMKAHQAINQRTFLARWRDTLATHPAPGGDLSRASEHRTKKRVLVIDACTPMPDRDSGSLRMFNLLRLLREEGHAVTFFPDNLKHDGAYTNALQQLGVQVWWNPWLRDVPRWFVEHGRDFDLIIASRHYVASNYLLLARKLAPHARFVFDTVDLHYLREQREAELSGDPGQQRQAQQTRARELRLIRQADLTLVVSPVEQALLAREAPDAAVEILSNVHRATASQTPFRERRDLVFVGGYRHPPNADAAVWLAREIYPLIRAHRPDIALHLIGSDATAEILALRDLDGVQVHGHVPDLAPYMDGCRIGLAPLRYGAGVKGKINLSMAHGQPVVATAAAVEGMYLRDGVDVLVADEPPAFAAAVLRLYEDADLWETLARNGLANLEQHFSFDAARRALRRVLG